MAKDVVANIIMQFRSCLPQEYQIFVELVEMLPGRPDSPVAPFVSLVLNINVATLAHCDAKDKLLCLVLAVGHFSGGGLVLREPGVGKMLVAVCEICSSLKGSAIHNQLSIPCIMRGNLTIPKYTMSP